MSFTPQQKTGILVGILVIIGGAAFVYLDPLDLDLLGLNEPPPVAQPAAPPRAPAPKAPVPATPPAATPAPSPAAVPAAETPVQAIPQAPKSTEPVKHVAKPVANLPERPRDQDLRHCLDLETDAAIAKCAGE